MNLDNVLEVLAAENPQFYNCWFCGIDDTDTFSFEFDTFVHRDCVLENMDTDDEARIMANEFNI